ncbi:uncharacterized protein PgNI_00213 [Pyricularia grisea]|uniref:Uncharacterized protein n=1 Tax=Pyricularia grisea TaxID=148305 RepID=A0A6P8BLA9_PYRGI|nr:uncharacterized protein PgNI_00213 [Pyricularia grisea]TLD17392.1 hypothetical protein PgNI_00213 [Pyricularia grisea]
MRLRRARESWTSVGGTNREVQEKTGSWSRCNEGALSEAVKDQSDVYGTSPPAKTWMGLSRIFWFGFWISNKCMKTRGPKMSARYVVKVGGAKQTHVNARPMWSSRRCGCREGKSKRRKRECRYQRGENKLGKS